MKAWMYLLLAPVFWGLNFHLAKVCLAHASFVETGFWRYLVGALALVALSARNLPSLAVVRTHWRGLLLVGLVGLFSFNLLFFLGLQYTTPLNGALIASLNPSTTLLLSFLLLHIPLQRQAVAGIAIAFFGVVWLLTKGQLGQLSQVQLAVGDLIMLVANLVFALHHVWVKMYMKDLPNLHFTMLTNLLCLVGFVLTMPFVSFGPVPEYPAAFWWAVLGMGGLGTAFAYFVWNEGVQRGGTTLAGMFMNILPLSTALFSVLFEAPLQFYHLVSGVIIIAGVWVMNAKKSPTPIA